MLPVPKVRKVDKGQHRETEVIYACPPFKASAVIAPGRAPGAAAAGRGAESSAPASARPPQPPQLPRRPMASTAAATEGTRTKGPRRRRGPMGPRPGSGDPGLGPSAATGAQFN